MGHLPEKKLCSLQKIQNRAFYLVESTPTKDQMPLARVNVDKIITYDWTIMAQKILGEKCPESSKGGLTYMAQISKYETRWNDLQMLKLQLDISKKRFSYVGAEVWNEVPNEIKNAESTHLFKQEMKIYLLDQ